MESLECLRQELFLMIFSRAGIKTELSRESASVEAIPRNWIRGAVAARSGSSSRGLLQSFHSHGGCEGRGGRRGERVESGEMRWGRRAAGGATARGLKEGSPDRGWRLV